ncbi:MAG: hydrogenase 4 subunit B [Candidatus Omnitrophica bacterium]|nr:hydrogenase 4 subunit B [Candidatus Omnitrophota bacterium]
MELFFILQLAFYVLGGVFSLFASAEKENLSRATHLLAGIAGGCGMVYSLAVLFGAPQVSYLFPAGLPLLGSLEFVVDPLSAFFVFLISFLSLATSIFAIGYTRTSQLQKGVPLLGFLYNFFILTMVLVVTVRNIFYFLIFWELMSIASYFLVVHKHERPEARRAGFIYFVMTHIGTAFITSAFILLFVNTGSFQFDPLSAHAPLLSPAWKNGIFLCALIGFGAKAGMIPLHIWLPEAHPQAPSHVSALMSGVMIKTAIYGLLRFLFLFLGKPFAWWGSAILIFAIFSTLFGVLYALMEQDLKKLLAFSSIENIGIILLGIGMAVFFSATNQPVLASFAVVAALYHVMNHAAFKGLLFLSAGAVLSQTHTGNMENLGGLIKKMPWTAFCFLVSAAAISALPPLNGFVSEWLTFVSLLMGFKSESVGIRFFAPILASLLAFASALVATCFVKAFGIIFLGTPRSKCVSESREVDFSMKLGMGMLAACCVLFALLAPVIISLLGKVAQQFFGSEVLSQHFVRKAFLIDPAGLSQFAPSWAFIAIVVVVLCILIATRVFLGKGTIRIGPSWDCGVKALSPHMQYTATGFSKPLRRIFSFLYQPTRRVEVEDEGHEILRTARRFESKVHPFFEETFYRPLSKWIGIVSQKVKAIQTGHIQLYLSYIFVTLVLLLIFLRLSR